MSESTNPLDDSRTVIALIDSTEGTGGIVDESPITLIVRCQSNRTEAYIDWHDYLGLDDTRVTYRFPPAAAETVTWGLSTDNEATFVSGAIPFLRTLVESDTLVVQTTPYNESPTTAIFDLAGAQVAVAPIAEECGWILDADEARQARRAREAAADRAREAQMAELVNQSFLLEDLFQIGSVGDSAYAMGGLPDGVSQAWFPGLTTSQLTNLRAAGGGTYSCPEAIADDTGSRIELRGCSISEESRRAIADAREAADRAAREAHRAEALAFEQRLAELVSQSYSLSDLSMFGGITNGAYAMRGVPEGVTRAVFPGLTVPRLSELTVSGSGTYTCEEAVRDGSGIELRGCITTE